MQSQKQKILNILNDRKWHSGLELNTPQVAGYHASQRISDLLNDGYVIDRSRASKAIVSYTGNPKVQAYRLVMTPSERIEKLEVENQPTEQQMQFEEQPTLSLFS